MHNKLQAKLKETVCVMTVLQMGYSFGKKFKENLPISNLKPVKSNFAALITDQHEGVNIL